jgi:hypothetical protein
VVGALFPTFVVIVSSLCAEKILRDHQSLTTLSMESSSIGIWHHGKPAPQQH